ncbi:MAG: SpoIIE family protein phosphatase [Spirochaetes bacterium]|nr:SpoIIE family protein phosphatase [Spirochaetota bacterium]
MRRVFYFIARVFNYTSAIAIGTAAVISIIMIAEFYLLDLFLGRVYEIILNLINIQQYHIFFAVMAVYFLQFGILSFIRIPAFHSFLRIINKQLKGRSINPVITDDDLRKLYKSLTRIPIYNTLIVFVLLVVSSAVFYITSYVSLSPYGDQFMILLMEYLRTSIILHGFVVVIATLLTYVLTDSLTSLERAGSYNELWKRNYFDRPVSYLRLRIKFLIIIALILISLGSFLFLIIQKQLYQDIAVSGFIIYFLSSVFAAIAIIILTSNSILRIFRDMSRVAQDITRELPVSFRVLPLEGEFADVEYLVLTMNKEIIEHRLNLEAKVAERTEELRVALVDLKERDDMVQKQLDMAGTIQRGILPGKINDWNELKFSVRYYAMEKIGGDFYDVQRMGSNKIGLYVADASGHGIPAALVTTMAKVSFGNAFLKYESPKKIFREVNRELLEHIKTQEYLTCFMVLIDDEYNVTYSNASHQKAIILRSSEGRIETLDTGGLFIGAIEDARDTYEEKTTRLNYGDRLILYTDGIPEALNPARESYSNEKFEQVILRNRDLKLKEFTNSLIEDLQNFVAGYQVQDDITLLVIELERDPTIDMVRDVRKLNSEKKYSESVNLLTNGLEKFPENQKLLYNLAKTNFMAGDFEKVIENINKYIRLESDNKYAYYLAGAASYKLHDLDSAVDLFQKALNIDSNFINALFAIGKTFKEKGQNQEAGYYFEKIKKIDEDNKLADYELNELNSAKEENESVQK